jgi:AraC-like DNA-binding protein
VRLGSVTYGEVGTPGNGFAVHRPVTGSVVLGTGRGEVVATTAAPAVLSPGDAGPIRWEPGTTALFLWMEPTAMDHELVIMIGARIAEPLLFGPEMDLSNDRVRGWLDLATVISSHVDSALLDHVLVGPYVERVLMRSLLLCQPNTYTQRIEDYRHDGWPEHVVAAVRVMEEDPQRPFTTASLARVVGVSARALQEGFRQHIGGTPMQFLRDARLRRVRLDLLSASAESVSEIALRWGFTHLGRFASYYRARYGELPSQTRRTH